jgi:hypothetical protein
MISSSPVTISSSLSLSNVKTPKVWRARCGAVRLALTPPLPGPPPIVLKPLSVTFCDLVLLEPTVLGSKGASQFLSSGKIMGRFVVKMAMKVSRVPQEAVSSALCKGS